MILIDTSVWIGWLRGGSGEPLDKLQKILDNRLPFGITGVIYQEILQGADSAASFHRLAAYFSTQHFYQPTAYRKTHANAAGLYRHCRQHGVTVRSVIDCLIAQLAVEHQPLLLPADRDFDFIWRVEPALRFF